MFHLAVVCLVGACAVFGNGQSFVEDVDDVSSILKPYVQSRASFTRAKVYLQQRVPYETRNITDPKARIHFANGIIVATMGALVEALDNSKKPYKPLKVLDKIVPLAWENYNEYAANPTNELLAEAQLKVSPIITLIDTLCSDIHSVNACNLEVEKKVNGNEYLRNRANLLLQLGVVSDIYLDKIKLIDGLTRKYEEIPYLIKNVDEPEITNIVRQLLIAYRLLGKATNA